MIYYSSPHYAGLRGMVFSRGALEIIAACVLPPSVEAAIRAMVAKL